MPTYVYKFVDSGETIEVQQAFTDDAFTEVAHPSDGQLRPVKKVFQPVGITFKGGGFYKTDSKGGSSATTPPGSSAGSTSSDSTGTTSTPAPAPASATTPAPAPSTSA